MFVPKQYHASKFANGIAGSPWEIFLILRCPPNELKIKQIQIIGKRGKFAFFGGDFCFLFSLMLWAYDALGIGIIEHSL